MNNKILLFFFLFLCISGQRLTAQGLLACPAGVSGNANCGNSCISCDLEGITDANVPINFPPPKSICAGALLMDAPRWYGFVAGSSTIILTVTPGQCLNGQGLEFAVVRGCDDMVACFPGPNNLVMGQYFVGMSGLIVGQPYQLLIDGFNGEACTYTINVIAGSTVPPPMGPLEPIQGLAQVCPNATVTYTIPHVTNAVAYTWTSPNGSSINGGGSSVTLPATGNNNSIDVTYGNAGGKVCVTASSACNPSQTYCLNISNVPLPSTQLEDLTVCFSEIPYEWAEEPHPSLGGPGTYNLTSAPYISYLGCDSIVKQKITLLPQNVHNLPLRYLCKDECFNINGLDYCETGSFQEYLTSENGCDSIINFNLIKIPSKAVVAAPDTITCAVTSVPLTGVGSTSGNSVTYRWLDPDGVTISNAITATAMQPGQFALIVTNTVGGIPCRDTAYVNVPGNLTPPLANAGPDRVLTCLITSIQLQGTGSAGPDYTYFWKALLGGNIVSGVTTLTPTVDAPGTYSLRVTNNHNGCTAVNNAVVTENITPPTVTTAGGTFTCSMPTIVLQVSTNASNPSFDWTGPNGFSSTLQNPVATVPGNYTVVVTNGITGCTASSTAVVNAGNGIPDVTATGGAITCIQNTVTLNATSSVQGVTYQWTGPGGLMSSLQSPVVTLTGTYQVVITAPNGCINSATAIVALNNTPLNTTLASSGSLNCNNTSVNLLASSAGNPANLVHEWTLPDLTTQNTGATAFLPATVPGVYSVMVSNSVSGCTGSASFTVVQYGNVQASISNNQSPKCFDSNDGSVSVAPSGGNGVYTYAWSNGPTTATNSNLGPGVYVVTVTDGETCTATLSVTVTAPDPVNTNATATNQTANGASDGTATANPTGGTPGYTYEWSTSAITQSISGLLPGSYTVTVTDANGCTAVKTVNVSQFDCTLQTDVIVHDISCSGFRDGSASLNFVGGLSPFNVTWSTGETTNSIDSLPAGQYSVSITDAANCPEVQTFTINDPSPLFANATGSTTSGSGVNDGTATATPTGGTGAYAYTWSNGETTATISNLAAGLYTVTVLDDNDCSDIQTVEVIAGNCNLVTDFQNTNPTCQGGANGAATIVLTGGAGGFTYAWSSGGNTATETGLTAGTHTVSVTDVNGCSIIVSTELVDPPALVLNVESVATTSCPNLPEGSITVQGTGGTGALTVTWSNGQTGFTATDLVAGTYTATLTDENSCTTTVSATVLSNDTEAPVIVANNTNVPIGPDGDVVLTVQNTNATVTDNCHVASVVFEPAVFNCTELGAHAVTITATDDAGHVTTQSITATIIDDADPILTCSPSLVNCFENNPVSYQAPTATDNCLVLGGMFNITAGLPIGAIFPVGSTTTTYTFTDAQGNMGSCSFEVTILSQLVLAVDTVINDINNQHVGAIFVNVTGSLPPYHYSWLLNGVEVSTQQNATGLGAGDYHLVVTDDNGCTISSQVITVQSVSGTHNLDILEGIRVFPNPTAGNLSILLPDELVDENVFLQIFDLTGRRVLDQTSLMDKQIDLTLLGISDGLYTLVIRINNNQVVRKIVLDR